MKARLTELSRALIRQRLRSTPPDCGEQQRSESVPECQNGMYRFARPAECAIPRITAHQCDEMIRLARAFLDASMRKTLRKTGIFWEQEVARSNRVAPKLNNAGFPRHRDQRFSLLRQVMLRVCIPDLRRRTGTGQAQATRPTIRWPERSSAAARPGQRYQRLTAHGENGLPQSCRRCGFQGG